MYELQLFDDSAGQYVPVETGEMPRDLMDMAKGMARRVINTMRGHSDYDPRFSQSYAKPLPLKPRILPGMSGKHKRCKAGTYFVPTNRIMEHYESLASTGDKITIHLWQNSELNHNIRCRFVNNPNVTLAYLDNETGESVL